MNGPIIFILSVLSAFPLYAQQVREFHVDAAKTTSLKLSDIAEKVIPIPLNKDVPGIQMLFETDEYLFLASLREVWQYDISGKYIRTISCGGGFVYGVAGDLVKKELYIPVRSMNGNGCEVWCYDFAGRLKKKITLKNSGVVSCLYHKNLLWILSEKLVDKKMRGYYSYVDITTGKETFVAHSFEKPSKILPSGMNANSIGFFGSLSVSDNRLFANWNDNIIWNIQKDRVVPVFKLVVAQEYKEQMLGFYKGVLGNYLYFNYNVDDDESYLYLRHLLTGKTFYVKYAGGYGGDAKGAIDDIYDSGFFSMKRTLNREGYFWFIKEMRGKSLGKTPVKGNQVIFIVKTKP